MSHFVSITGGCLCGAVRYRATAEPLRAGLCYCVDCRKASGSGFIPFMGFAASAIVISGETRASHVASFRGGIATRNHCARCASLVFGGVVGESESFTIYAGSLDDPELFEPTLAIFTRDRPAWAEVRTGLIEYDTIRI